MSTKRHALVRLDPKRLGRTPPEGEHAYAPSGTHVAECIDASHPTLLGRVRVRWQLDDVESRERWVPTLKGIVVRAGDRVLLLDVLGAQEPVVVGVVDGFARRPEPPRHIGPTIELKEDELLRVQAENGEGLLEIVQSAEGPVVRLLHGSTQLELPGKLLIRASEIELRAERGGVRIEANDDVVVQGEMVRLN